jgi:hypothetical protein
MQMHGADVDDGSGAIVKNSSVFLSEKAVSVGVIMIKRERARLRGAAFACLWLDLWYGENIALSSVGHNDLHDAG